MTSAMAKGAGCSSQVSGLVSSMQDKGSRNKRKFRAEPQPVGDANRAVSSVQNEGLSYEFSAEKIEVNQGHVESSGCDMCGVDDGRSDELKLQIGLSYRAGASGVRPSQPAVKLDGDKFQIAGWSDDTAPVLKELVLSNLDGVFKCAIKKIVSCGYTEDVATRAVLKSGVCYGSKDPVSNVVDNTSAFLRSGQDINSSGNTCFENLQELEKYILAELICVLKEVRPFFSTGDALWWLLLCDLNISHACAVDSGPVGSNKSDGASSGSSGISTHPQLKAEVKNTELRLPIAHKAVSSSTSLHSAQSEATTVSEASSITKPKNPVIDKPISVTRTCQPPAMEEKFISSRRVPSGYSKREILRQKSLHLEKGYRTYGTKGSSRSGKLGGLGGRVLDKKVKYVPESSTVSLKTTSTRISKAMGINMPQDSAKENPSAQTGSLSPVAFKLETSSTVSSFPKADLTAFPSVIHSPPALPVVPTSPGLPTDDTELSLSLPRKSNSSIASSSCSTNTPTCSFSGVPKDKSLGQWIPQGKKDVTILKLVPKVRELQTQLQEWTGWANQKVMQAARRLGQDKDELKMLRQEKEEVERLKKDKQALEESTMKKLTEMENALYKASGQVDRANAAVCRLEVENAALKKEMEAAKLRAAESAASCQEASEREKKTLMECRSWEREKGILQDELTSERRKLAQFLQELEQAKVLKEQAESRWKQEEKAKDELLMEASSQKREREQIEASTKTKEDMIKSKAEKNIERCKDDIERLEKEISQLRLKTDSSRIAALKQGIDGSYVSKLLDAKTGKAQKDFQSSVVSAAQFLGFSEIGGVKRERECVMCLSEEMSVVFLPCAHQVVCNACNELHEKQGMKECPSCRSLIQRRISVRYARS